MLDFVLVVDDVAIRRAPILRAYDLTVSVLPHRVVDNTAELRYEIWVDRELAGYIRYRLEGDTVVLVHTDVEPRWAGGWVGRTLVRETLEDLRSRGLSAAPICPYIRNFVTKNPEYAPLVVADPAVGD